MENNKALVNLFNKLKITPKSYFLYIEALTHASYHNDKHLSYDYERLEFLGDQVISFVVCEYLFNQNPKLDVGQMSKDKILIVQAKSEVITAKNLNLNLYIKIGKSIANSKNNFNEKILEDVYEALMGAIYLDLGYNTAKRVITNTLISNYKTHKLNNVFDYKTKLQEMMMKYNKHEIQYHVVNNKPNHYKVELWCNNIKYGIGSGTKIKEAEQNAAKAACKKFAGTKNIWDKNRFI